MRFIWKRFYSNNSHQKVWLNSPLVAKYSEMPLNPVTLDYLLTLERDVTVCAKYVHRELPIRLARRVRGILFFVQQSRDFLILLV